MVEPVSVESPRGAAAPVRAAPIDERVVDGELVLYDPLRQRVHALNPTAAFIWRSCDGRLDQTGIIAELSRRYPESRQEIEADVPAILGRLREEGLLEW